MNFEEVKNPNTGAVEKVASFKGELVSVAEKALTNTNGTEYYPASVKIAGIGTRSCMIYKKNFDYGMQIGTSYAGRVTISPNSEGVLTPIITLSHLTGAERASLADFGLAEEVSASANLDDVK